MGRFSPPLAVLALAGALLFTMLGGPAWAAGLINGSQIQNRSITSNKIGRGQIKTANLATGAVTALKVAPDSLTGKQIDASTLGTVPNATHALTADNATHAGTADTATNAGNSALLGGIAASGFVQGAGNLIQHRIDVPAGTSGQFLLDTGLGEVDGSCLAGAKPEVSFTAEAQPLNLVESGITFGGSPDINTVNGLTIGSTYTEPNTTPGAAQAIDFQVAQSFTNPPSRVATVWTTDQPIGGTDCIFTAQAVTTGA